MAELSTAEDVLAAALGGLGLQAAVDAVRSVTALARCVGPRGPYETDIFSARGGHLAFRQRWPDRPSLDATISGEFGWIRDATTGAITALDAESAAAIRSHDFQMLALDLLAHFREPVLIGHRPFAGKVCYELGMRDMQERLCRAFYTLEETRWAGMEAPDSRAPTNPPIRVTIDEWREVQGMALPSHVTATDLAGAFVFDFYTLSLNGIDPALFIVPATLDAPRA